MAPSRRSVLRRSLALAGGVAVAGCSGATDLLSGEDEAATPTDRTTPARERGQADANVTLTRSEYYDGGSAGMTCACAAADAVKGYIASNVDGSVGVAIGCGPSAAENAAYEVRVSHYTLYGRDGEVQTTPGVEYDRLVSQLPASASATIEDDGESYSCTVPVYVVHEGRQLE